MVKGKFMKPVLNNGEVDAPLQFKIKHDTDKAKKIKPKQVFEYIKPEDNIKNRLRPRPRQK